VVIAQDFTKPTHIRIGIDVSKQVQQKQAWGIIARRSFIGVTICYQGSDKGEIDQRGDHIAHTAFDVTVWEYFNEPFFEPITIEEASIRERF